MTLGRPDRPQCSTSMRAMTTTTTTTTTTTGGRARGRAATSRSDGTRGRRREGGARVVARAKEASGFEGWLEDALGSSVVNRAARGGSQWAAFESFNLKDGRRAFVKTSAKDPSMFAGEAAGLRALRAAGAFVVPEVYGTGVPPEGERSNSFIAMEYLNFGARGDQGEFGDALATMHLAAPSHKEASAGKFGFERNNTIGETHQPNEWTDSWLEFWRDKRLMHMIRLARDPTLSQLAEKVVDKRLSDMFSSCGEIKPSLLHGDLWSGNIGTVGKKPSVFDPAVYYGHHEADFGMSWCAGFTPAFYEAYHAKIPKAPGFEERAKLYRLYHYLNHYVMFGGGYYRECVNILKELA